MNIIQIDEDVRPMNICPVCKNKLIRDNSTNGSTCDYIFYNCSKNKEHEFFNYLGSALYTLYRKLDPTLSIKEKYEWDFKQEIWKLI